jgi:hypothetical protein
MDPASARAVRIVVASDDVGSDDAVDLADLLGHLAELPTSVWSSPYARPLRTNEPSSPWSVSLRGNCYSAERLFSSA